LAEKTRIFSLDKKNDILTKRVYHDFRIHRCLERFELKKTEPLTSVLEKK